MERNTDIEVLRAIAIIFVVIGHIPDVWPQFSILYKLSWWTGVDLFFCISGFVISGVLVGKIDQAQSRYEKYRVSLKFWLRRIYRLLPSGIFWAVFLVAAVFFYNHTNVFGSPDIVLVEFVSVLTYTKNFMNFYAPVNSMGVYWSLSLEEQFYAFFPFFLIMVGSSIVRLRLIGVAILLLFFLPKGDHTLWGWLRIDPLLWGIVIYHFSRSDLHILFKPAFLEKKHHVWFPALLLCLMVSIPVALEAMPFHHGLIGVVSAIMVWVASYNENYLDRFALSRRLLVWLGGRSYVIYLCHLPAFFLVYETWFRITGQYLKEIPASQAVYGVICAVALTMVFAEMTHRLLEEPLRQYGRKVADRV